MIPRDDELQVISALRANVVEMVGAIRDSSGGWMQFNDPSPNWQTSNSLKACLVSYENALLGLGFVRVELHAPCGAPGHEERAQAVYGRGGYWRYVLNHGKTDADLAVDGRIVLNEMPMDTVFEDAIGEQISSRSPCACRPGKTANEHSVSSYFLRPHRTCSRFPEMAALTLMLKEAVYRSEDRRRRSGIREVLLQTFIKIDRIIVEETAEEVLLRRNIVVD